jgi:hypothetical protein
LFLGWFGRKGEVIHKGEGPITNIKWKGNMIAWANSEGVKIYDTERNQLFAYIEKPSGR